MRMTQDLIDHLIAVKQGKEKPEVCNGIHPYTHAPTKRDITFGDKVYSYCCPLCGFGSAGGLSIQDREKIHSVTKEKDVEF